MQITTYSPPFFSRRPSVASCWLILGCLSILMGLVLFLGSCDTGGESGEISEPTTPRPQLAQQAIANLLDLYRTALRQEDIDRLQDLLQPPGPSDQPPLQQANDEEVLDIERFRQLFRTRTMMALDIADSRISADRRQSRFRRRKAPLISPRFPNEHACFTPLSSSLRRKAKAGLPFALPPSASRDHASKSPCWVRCWQRR